ncbi:glycosyltransferase family 2 protein [Penaeicola halotolerans]|uniref:glycosyltransferase family 2 protein n=1 Tax=Penaeicola halotolerans TaxID=2793196 RepID=UPI001CF80A7D|nr:glycosyltransferase [Penaeicola halotolerans]
MTFSLTHFLVEAITLLLFIYSFLIISSYIVVAILAAIDMRSHVLKQKYTDYRAILSSPIVPKISIIAPAYNEAMTIVENIKSLMSLHYSKFEVIIVNDGSKDNSLEKMIDSFDLVKVDYAYNEVIKAKKVRGVYKSKDKSYAKLIVVDKENGGKADALNVGINVSSGKLFACIDVDCILSSDALLRMVKPFLEETNKKVIAVGGVIGIANNCDIKDGKVVKYRLPNTLLGRVQVIEYFRAFLIGRMAWAKIDGLILISGAFGFFDRELVLKVGGYSTKTVGEDMELIVRMRAYMEERKFPYKVPYIPDPLCWTEVPETEEILKKQRNRWMRGSIETLNMHRKLLFNPRFRTIGMISFPYWLIFEKYAPLVEVFGAFFTIVLFLMGHLNFLFFVTLMILIYAFSVLFSLSAIFLEELAYNNYEEKGSIKKLIKTLLLEPFTTHPKVVMWGINGYIDYLKGKGGWGDMTRAGFAPQTPTTKPKQS